MLIGLSALWLLTPALAQDDPKKVSVNVTVDSEVRMQRYNPSPFDWTGGSKPRFVEEVTRVTGRANTGRWSFQAQIDQVAFIGLPHIVDGESKTNTPIMYAPCFLDDGICVSNPFGNTDNRSADRFYMNPEKLAVSWTGDNVEVTVGDFYGAFGVGSSLNLNRNVDNDTDTSIQGVKVVARPGDWEVTGVFGTLNNQQVFQDNPMPSLLDGDRRHIVAGARLERFGLGPADVGIHGVMYDFVSDKGMRGALDELGSAPDVVSGGASTYLSAGGVDWNVQADVFAYPEADLDPRIWAEGETKAPGHALYGAGVWFWGNTTWQAEFKRYKNVYRMNNVVPVAQGFQIVAPPTMELERAINIDTAAVTGSNDLTAGLLRVDIEAADGVLPYIALGVGRDTDTVNAAQKSPVPESIFQIQAGAEILRDHWSLILDAVGRVDRKDRSDGINYGEDVQLYAAADIKAPLPIGAGTQISLIGHHFNPGATGEGEAEDLKANTPSWHEFNASCTVLATSNLGITGFYDHTTNPVAGSGAIGTGGNLSEKWPAAYGAGELFWKPSSSWTIKAFHGGYAAGIRCSGGQCRNVPAFTGSRISVTGTFQ
ncbi:MAG: hypothetical protein AB8H79_14180 [Myxococcota bacterium]